MSNKIFVNKYVPENVSQDLKWYERDGLLTYINQIKYERFSEDPHGYLKKAVIVNFDIKYSQIRGLPRQNSDKYYQIVRTLDVKKVSQKERKKAVGACLRSEQKDLHVEKKLALSHF